MIKIVIDPNQFHYKNRIIEGISEEDKNDLNEKLCSKFNELYIDKQILDIGYYDLVGLFAWTTMDDELKNKTKTELQKTPNKIFSILDIFLTIDEAGIFSSINNLAQLDKQISCKELYDIVKDKVAIDNDRKKESQLELLKEHSSV